jgi:hypothetical protein
LQYRLRALEAGCPAAVSAWNYKAERIESGCEQGRDLE